MIYTNETVESDLRREAFVQAIKDDVKEEGSLNCLLTVIHTIRDLVAEDSMINIYNGKPLNDAHLVRMFELHDARKKESIPYLMHKEMDIPLLECQKAYDVAIDYLRSQAKVRG